MLMVVVSCLACVRHGLGFHHGRSRLSHLLWGLVGPASTFRDQPHSLSSWLVWLRIWWESSSLWSFALHLVVEGRARGEAKRRSPRRPLCKVQVVSEGSSTLSASGADPVDVPLHVAVAPPVGGDQRHPGWRRPRPGCCSLEQPLGTSGSKKSLLSLRREVDSEDSLEVVLGGRGHGAPRVLPVLGEGQRLMCRPPRPRGPLASGGWCSGTSYTPSLSSGLAFSLVSAGASRNWAARGMS